MTIASEITRLQGAKADIRQAIIDKGVDVPASDNIDCYAGCIADIPTGGGLEGQGLVDVLLVGGGGGGGSCTVYNGAYGGGGGSGGIIETTITLALGCCNTIKVGKGGCGGDSSCSYCVECISKLDGGSTSLNDLVAIGGGGGGYASSCSCPQFFYKGNNGASGGGATGFYTERYKGKSLGGLGNDGGLGCGVAGGGGGGPGGAGGNGVSDCCGGCGGAGYTSCFTLESKVYGGGGGGGSASNGGCGGGVGGRGIGYCQYSCSCRACACGFGGGGGGTYAGSGGKGGDGVALVRYKADGSCGINVSSGGAKYTCGEYVFHRFNCDGNLYLDNIQGAKTVFRYLLVGGGGGGGSTGGGGGGDVLCGEGVSDRTEFNITIGAGGERGGGCSCACSRYGGDGTASSIIDDCNHFSTTAEGGKGGQGNCFGGNSGSGCIGYNGGAGASGNGGIATAYTSTVGNGGAGLFGYGGGGGAGNPGGSSCNSKQGKGVDGGGNGGMNYFTAGCNAVNCGGGGGGYTCCNSISYGGNGACGLAKICYPTDGSYGYTCATGGTCCTTTTAGGIEYCVHRFKSNGTFCIVC